MEKSTRQRMIENITLLWTLNEVPEQPKENVVDRGTDGTRQLTLEREIQLASNFAFISASTDNMLRVMAVCVEESSDQQGLTIRLASNTGDLSRTTESFKDIANTIERAGLRVDPRVVIRQDLFRQIFQLDKPRILSRLRSKHATTSRKTAGKPALTDLLSRALGDPSIGGTTIGKSNLERVRSQSVHLSETFTKLEAISNSHEAPNLFLNILADLLHQIFEFDTDYLLEALHTSSASDPSLKTFLPEAIKKLGRYYSIANELIDAARNASYTVFRHVSIEVLETPTIDLASVTRNLQGFEAALQRNMGQRRDDWQPHSPSLTETCTKFQSRIQNCATPWKIHAEMQLLFFYEQNPDIPHPRAICSSKSACYLCDLFIKIHGEFHTPRTHGRLYDKWTLPEWALDQPSANQRIQSAVVRFNNELEAKIVQSLNNTQHAYPHPTESILYIAEPWPSASTLPRVASEKIGAGSSSGGPHNVSKKSEGSPATVPCQPTDLITELTSKSTVNTIQAQNADLCYGTGLNGDEIGQASLPGPDFISRTLLRGDFLFQKLNPLSDGLIVRTKALDLHISWQWDQTDCNPSNTEARDGRWIRVEWLASESSEAAGEEVANSINVEMLASGQEKIIESNNASNLKALSIKNRDHTLLVQWYDDFTLPKQDLPYTGQAAI